MFLTVSLLIALGAIGVTVYASYSKYAAWKALPTLDQYFEKNPSCKTSRGVRCAQCSGGSFKNWGIFGPHDSRREFSCNHCGKKLYRAKL